MITTAQVADLVLGHMATHALPEPASLTLLMEHPARASVQAHGGGLADTAGVLLRWAITVPSVTVGAWRPTSGDRVHLHIDITLNGPAGSVDVQVYGGVPADVGVFPGLEPGARQPVSLGDLAAWATGGTGEAA